MKSKFSVSVILPTPAMYTPNYQSLVGNKSMKSARVMEVNTKNSEIPRKQSAKIYPILLFFALNLDSSIYRSPLSFLIIDESLAAFSSYPKVISNQSSSALISSSLEAISLGGYRPNVTKSNLNIPCWGTAQVLKSNSFSQYPFNVSFLKQLAFPLLLLSHSSFA